MIKGKVKKNKKIPLEVIINVYSYKNNTIINASDLNGDVLIWASGGSMGFKGSKKSSPFAAQSAASKIARELKNFNVEKIKIFMKGIGAGRESVIKALSDFYVTELRDCTPLAFNGTRPPKARKM